MQNRNQTIGERARYYRTSRKLTLAEVGAKLKPPVSAQQLARYETGQSRWPADMVCALATVLRVDVRLLLSMEDGEHERRESHEWEAERYKTVILRMKEKPRKIVYRIIDGISAL